MRALCIGIHTDVQRCALRQQMSPPFQSSTLEEPSAQFLAHEEVLLTEMTSVHVGVLLEMRRLKLGVGGPCGNVVEASDVQQLFDPGLLTPAHQPTAGSTPSLLNNGTPANLHNVVGPAVGYCIPRYKSAVVGCSSKGAPLLEGFSNSFRHCGSDLPCRDCQNVVANGSTIAFIRLVAQFMTLLV